MSVFVLWGVGVGTPGKSHQSMLGWDSHHHHFV
jgi:hypothetical protein